MVKIHRDLGNEVEETYAIAILIKDNLGFYTWKYSNDSFTTLNNKDSIITSVFDFNNNAFKIEDESTFEIVAWKEVESIDQLKIISLRKLLTIDDLYSRDGVKITEKQFRILINTNCTFDEDGCIDSDTPFEVKDLDSLVKASEKAIINLYNKYIKINHNIADFSEELTNNIGDFTWKMQEIQDNGYIFISATLLKYVGECRKQWDFEFTKDGKMKYKLINDGKCEFTAY